MNKIICSAIIFATCGIATNVGATTFTYDLLAVTQFQFDNGDGSADLTGHVSYDDVSGTWTDWSITYAPDGWTFGPTINPGNTTETGSVNFQFTAGDMAGIEGLFFNLDALADSGTPLINITDGQVFAPFTTGLIQDDIVEGILILQPVPVPAAVWLFGSGLVGLIRVRRNNLS